MSDIRPFAGFLADLERDASDTPDRRWLAERSDAIWAVHREMLAERQTREAQPA